MKITSEGYQAITYLAQGDLRRAINGLQMAAAAKKEITPDVVYQAVAAARPDEVKEALELALDGNYSGARERLVYEPWSISIGSLNLNYTMGSSLDESNLSAIYNNDFLIDFCLKILVPLFLFSGFHLVGLFYWYKGTNKLGFPISIYPLSVGLLPLLMHPIMRYYIPLIPISCIGFSLFLSKIFSGRLNYIGENINYIFKRKLFFLKTKKFLSQS